MPLGSEAADHEIANGSVTEAESAGLSGRGAVGAASAGATPTTSVNPNRTSNARSRAFNAPLLVGLTGDATDGYTRAIPQRFARVLNAGFTDRPGLAEHARPLLVRSRTP